MRSIILNAIYNINIHKNNSGWKYVETCYLNIKILMKHAIKLLTRSVWDIIDSLFNDNINI